MKNSFLYKCMLKSEIGWSGFLNLIDQEKSRFLEVQFLYEPCCNNISSCLFPLNPLLLTDKRVEGNHNRRVFYTWWNMLGCWLGSTISLLSAFSSSPLIISYSPSSHPPLFFPLLCARELGAIKIMTTTKIIIFNSN